MAGKSTLGTGAQCRELRGMKVRFWGVRGSIPTPVTPDEMRRKIASVVQRIRPEDLQSPTTREQFLGSLPPWLFGTYGGNSACIEIRLDDNSCIILDGGSGIRALADSLAHELRPVTEFHIFITHFHYDHLQGFPFFRSGVQSSGQHYLLQPRKGIRRNSRKPYETALFPRDDARCDGE